MTRTNIVRARQRTGKEIMFRKREWYFVVVIAILACVFLFLSSELLEANAGQKEWVGRIDQDVLSFFAKSRTPGLSGIAVSVTSLGSWPVLTILVLGLSLFLISFRRFVPAVQITVAALGSALLTPIFKSHFQRSRPSLEFHAVNVQGFSYPSGHSLGAGAVYVMMALICWQHIPHLRGRLSLLIFFLVLVLAVGLSRMYLGVHFFSDVSAGILLGVAWSLIVTVAASSFKSKAKENTNSVA